MICNPTATQFFQVRRACMKRNFKKHMQAFELNMQYQLC